MWPLEPQKPRAWHPFEWQLAEKPHSAGVWPPRHFWSIDGATSPWASCASWGPRWADRAAIAWPTRSHSASASPWSPGCRRRCVSSQWSSPGSQHADPTSTEVSAWAWYASFWLSRHHSRSEMGNCYKKEFNHQLFLYWGTLKFLSIFSAYFLCQFISIHIKNYFEKAINYSCLLTYN